MDKKRPQQPVETPPKQPADRPLKGDIPTKPISPPKQ